MSGGVKEHPTWPAGLCLAVSGERLMKPKKIFSSYNLLSLGNGLEDNQLNI